MVTRACIVVLCLFVIHGKLRSQPAPDNAKIVSLRDLLNGIDQPTEKIKVLNFWATWCAPCIKEIPLFEKLNKEDDDVLVLLVSVDLDLDPNPQKVYNFIQRRGIVSDVLILDATDPNSWIDMIDPAWSGALPATLLVNSKTGRRIFVEKEMHDGDLERIITELRK